MMEFSDKAVAAATKPKQKYTLNKKWSFPLRIYSVNVTKSAVSCGFGQIYWRKP